MNQLQPLPSREEIARLCKENDIGYLALFGSRARDQTHTDSDIDLLADFTQTKSLFELSRIQRSFEKSFGTAVDLVERVCVKESLKPYIFSDITPLYGTQR